MSGGYGFVAFATRGFEMLAVENPNDAATITNGSLLLKRTRGNRNRRSACPENSRERLLRQGQVRLR
jgi:hypothetical protein